jgi:hypothetical protein
MNIDWKYPLIWQLDTRSFIKSLWLGWWLITWNTQDFTVGGEHRIGNLVWSINFQPGL